MSNQTNCRSCKHEPIRNGRYFAFQEVIAPVSIEIIEADGFFNGWHKDAAGTPRLRIGDHMRVYSGKGVIADTLDAFEIYGEAEFAVTFSEVNDVRVKRLGDWLMYEAEADNSVDEAVANENGYSKKWNPGKQAFEMSINGEVVALVKDKEHAAAIVDGTMTLADAA